MAGTPTPNYQFPTYAETDTPNLAGAYNQAVNAIDAKIKEVADTIPSGADVPDATSTTKGIAKLYDSTTVGAGDQDDGGITPKAVDDKIGDSLTGYAPKFTVAAPITYSGNQIGVSSAGLTADGTSNGTGVVMVTGKQGDIAAGGSLTSIAVPNCKAVKDYVDAKVPTEQQAYTGTAPIEVDSGERTIGIHTPQQVTAANYTNFLAQMQENQANYVEFTGSSYPVVEGASVANSIYSMHNDAYHWPAAFCVPNLNTVMGLILNTFTGTEPVIVNKANKTISVRQAGIVVYDEETGFSGTADGLMHKGLITDFNVYKALFSDTDAANRPSALSATACVNVVHAAIDAATPDASQSVKGLVQLTNTFTASNTTNAATPNCIHDALTKVAQNWEALINAATTQLTTEMLANLYVTPSGVVVYKAPTE
jgi:hypothetical protein